MESPLRSKWNLILTNAKKTNDPLGVRGMRNNFPSAELEYFYTGLCNMVDYRAHIRLDSGAALVEAGSKRFRIAETDTDRADHLCPTELIVGAFGS